MRPERMEDGGMKMEEAILLTPVGRTRPCPHPTLRLSNAGRIDRSPDDQDRQGLTQVAGCLTFVEQALF